MDDSISLGKRRTGYSSLFSPQSYSHSLLHNRQCEYVSTPKSSRALNPTEYLHVLVDAIQSKDVDSFMEAFSGLEDVNVNEVISEYSMSLLHYSVGSSDNQIEIVEALLRKGGDPNNMDINEQLSPLHLSALYDFDNVMSVLVEYGGDPKLKNGDGQSCFDIVRQNVEDELLENCFRYLFPRSRDFRKSLGTCLGNSQSRVGGGNNFNKKQNILHDSGSDGFYSCESQVVSETNSHIQYSEKMHSMARRLYPLEYTNLMTEDESADAEDDDERGVKLTTIPEESGIISASSPQIHGLSFITPSPQRPYRGIGSMTAPLYVHTDDSISYISDTSASCMNSTPEPAKVPTKYDLERLQNQMKHLNIPITPSTYGVITKFSESDSRMQSLLSPKCGAKNFSPELQAGIQDLQLLNDWGNLKIDFLQNATPTSNISKSFYNYLLLDPQIIKRVNFSGDYLKAGIINNNEKFLKYLESIFYIGKAHGKRPLQHLVEAKQKYNEMGRKTLKNGQKMDKILEIWKSGLGVIIVSVFLHSSEREANVNEAAMIDAMGLVELSNQKKGSYTGTVTASWPQKNKNQLGSFLLLSSFRNFVVSEPKHFHPQDFA